MVWRRGHLRRIARRRTPRVSDWAVRSLFDHLEAGDSIDDFLEGFPSVRREQVIAVLEASRKELLQPA